MNPILRSKHSPTGRLRAAVALVAMTLAWMAAAQTPPDLVIRDPDAPDIPTVQIETPQQPAAQDFISAPVAVPTIPVFDESARILAPTLGRPTFVEPGGVLEVVAQVADGFVVESAHLSRRGAPWLRRPLAQDAGSDAAAAGGQPIRLRVPPDAPDGVYDLELRGGAATLTSRHCVAVGRVGTRVRLVHLSNMNLGDPSAPLPDRRLIEEINLLSPTLVICTGDYLDALHPDPRAGWEGLIDFLTEIDAPLLMACGDHDDIEHFSRHVAPSPIGELRVGPYRALVLYDHMLAPILTDEAQVRWVESVLGRPGDARMTWIVTHGDAPNLLRRWRAQQTLSQNVAASRLGLWLAGGHRDWNGEYADELLHAAPMLYIRTHQASTAVRDGAAGVSHYRVIDVQDGRVVIPAEQPASDPLPPSMGVGRLAVQYHDANDGGRDRVRFTAVNGWGMRLDGLAARIRVRKSGSEPPWCLGGRLEQAIDAGGFWECRVGFDLPDKGAATILVGVGPRPPEPAMRVRFEAPAQMAFVDRVTPDGVPYQSAVNQAADVLVHNAGPSAAAFVPVVRLDGDPLAYAIVGEHEAYATGYRLTLAPGQTARLRLDLSAIRVRPGRRELQVHLRAGEADVPICHAIHVTTAGAAHLERRTTPAAP